MSDTARRLVRELIAADEWPEPELLEEILEQEEAAVEPLREIVRQDVHGWPEEAPLCFAIDLLGSLGAVAAIPDLIALFRRYDNETLQSASTTLGVFGAPAIDPLLEVVRDTNLNPYQRTEAATAAILAASADDGLRERVAAVLRELLSDLVARAEDLTGEEMEMASFLVSDLTQLADPQGRALIDAAFEAGIVDTMLLGPDDVDYYYERGRAEVLRPERRDWLEEYEELYQEEMDSEREQITRPPNQERSRGMPPTSYPIERTGPQLGRNDPCWCGSGKKYKHCHLGQDRL
jgi:hypothetical protein